MHHLLVPEEPMLTCLCPSTWHGKFVLLAKLRLNTAVPPQGDFEFKGTQVSDNWGGLLLLLLLKKGRMFKEIQYSYFVPAAFQGRPFVGQKPEKMAIEPNLCNDCSIAFNVNNDLPGK